MGFSRDELESFRDTEIDDLVGPGLRMLFVGVNPGLWTAATGTPFAHPGNRFFPALVQAGILSERPGFARGLNEAERERIVGAGIGITNLVRRATARAAELSRDELRAGAEPTVLHEATYPPKDAAHCAGPCPVVRCGRPSQRYTPGR